MSPAGAIPAFCDGILYFGTAPPRLAALSEPAIAAGRRAIARIDEAAVYQTRLVADALRYTTLQLCASKASGHPGGFASAAEVVAALILLGHKNLVTEVGHHAPGFYSSLFLDGSLEAMGITTMAQLQARFRERGGLLGHLSGAIPGLLAPAGPLGQGQHFAMAGAYLHRDLLFPCTIGDGGLGEPYVLSAMKHFHTSYPEVTNFLPVLIWNGYSQEHHAMVSRMDNAAMRDYWHAHGFARVILVDAQEYDDSGQPGAYVDSTLFSDTARDAFTRDVLQAAQQAGDSAMGGTATALIVKQLKGAGMHAHGAKSHNLYPGDTPDKPIIAEALAHGALAPEAWALVRTLMARAGGGPAAEVAVTEQERPLPEVGALPTKAFTPGEQAVPAGAMGAMAAALGERDPLFVVTNADGNEASAMKVINERLKIRHPTPDEVYHQSPTGQVYEPLSEDACAGLAAGVALFGGRSLWLSYESFAVNGWPIVQTVAQAMAELRRRTPAVVSLFTAGALEQGRNGWTHQRPEIENYIAGQMRNGNSYLLYPCDANVIQAAYGWALGQSNKSISLVASKSALPVYTTPAQAERAVEDGAVGLYESAPGEAPLVVFAVTGDMVLLPVFAARDRLEAAGRRVRIVAVVNPRRLFRPGDVAWMRSAEPDGRFLGDAAFAGLFDGDALLGVSGGGTLALEPVLLRTRSPGRDLAGWQRGETTASPAEIMAYNGLISDELAARAEALL